uniref:Uncharacterized protein n=1 Tax=Vitis vinifera TaxID=29760 RepID=A5AJX9_VITVI|nr:hypothetical protein VITISV_015450 [Vitis vinifera]
MVLEGLDVVGATGGIVGVIREVVEAALGMGTGGAKVGDAGAGIGVDCACSACGGTRGATMGGDPGGAE